ncbi:prepilin-type N-terminal cleavage/methylation domain-containing protein [Candidatus Parcubacteria bacterium]|nr:prepilin-type N-terminal cleavage/methylation domain-containing protein [Candidatus Parcubacteria bacterium]
MLKCLHDKSGFSLVEILVVVFIVSIMLSVAIISGRSFNDSINLENTVKSIDMKIKLAKSRSISALNGTNHSVHFKADKVVVFEGNTFDASAPTNEVLVFSDNIKINMPVSLSGGGDDLIFNRLIGSTYNPGNINIEVKNDPSKTKQIIINSDGQTSLNSFQTSIEPLITNARHMHFHLDWDIKNATTLSLEWRDPDFDSHIITNDIDIASHLNDDQSIFDWTGTVVVDAVDQKMRIHSWLDASNHTVLCIIREQTENDKLYIYTDAGTKDIATYENIDGEIEVTCEFDCDDVFTQ